LLNLALNFYFFQGNSARISPLESSKSINPEKDAGRNDQGEWVDRQADRKVDRQADK